MSSLFALLSQQNTSLTTRKGLIILGLQNDFVRSDGKLPVQDTGYLQRIVKIVPQFREFGNVIWVRSEYESNRSVNGLDTSGDTVVLESSASHDDEVPTPEGERDGSPVSTKKRKASRALTTCSNPDIGEDDEELFLSRSSIREPCCVRGSRGAEYADEVKSLIQRGKDLEVVKTHYSAFGGTSLLLTLRSKLITDLYVCGNMTNLSVYATAMDAARYGIQITLIDDCLGYRNLDRHNFAMKQLYDLMSAESTTSKTIISELCSPPAAAGHYQDEDSEDDERLRLAAKAETAARRLTTGDYKEMLEVDSETSDEKVTLPIVRAPGQRHGRRLEVRCRNGSGRNSPSIAGAPRIFTSEIASSKLDHHSRAQPISRTFHGFNRIKSDNSKFAGHSWLRAESQSAKKMPWLDLLPKSSSPETAASPPPTKHRGLAAFATLYNLHDSTVAEWEAMRVAKELALASERARTSKPLLGEDKEEESAGSSIRYDLLPDESAETVFEQLRTEVDWQSMYHRAGAVPRLVCCQGTIGEDGSMPVYRHPSDQTIPLHNWTPTVDRVRIAAEREVGHALNHALIQLYRGGNDYISEHSDKTLDIAHGSNIVNVSFGAQRTMRLRTKRTAEVGSQRTSYGVPMPHNSMVVMSLRTNAEYYHGIKADKRPRVELSQEEKAYGGQRISITFRKIATYLDQDSKYIWGQGATGKIREEARVVVDGNAAASQAMLNAFGVENNTTSITWDEIYGGGFDVLHLRQQED